MIPWVASPVQQLCWANAADCIHSGVLLDAAAGRVAHTLCYKKVAVAGLLHTLGHAAEPLAAGLTQTGVLLHAAGHVAHKLHHTTGAKARLLALYQGYREYNRHSDFCSLL